MLYYNKDVIGRFNVNVKLEIKLVKYLLINRVIGWGWIILRWLDNLFELFSWYFVWFEFDLVRKMDVLWGFMCLLCWLLFFVMVEIILEDMVVICFFSEFYCDR